MKPVSILKDNEPFPGAESSVHNSPSGILNSSYKTIVKQNFSSLKTPSLFSIKQRLKGKQFNRSCAIAGTLKISLFIIGLLIALN